MIALIPENLITGSNTTKRGSAFPGFYRSLNDLPVPHDSVIKTILVDRDNPSEK